MLVRPTNIVVDNNMIMLMGSANVGLSKLKEESAVDIGSLGEVHTVV